MGQKYLLIGLLSLFFLAPGILSPAAEKELRQDRHEKFLKFKTDFQSQRQKLKNLRPMIENSKIGPGLNRYISPKISGKTLQAPLSTANTGNNKDKVRIILETSNDVDLDPDTIKRYGGSILNKRYNLTAVEIPADRIEAMVNDIDDIQHARLPLRFFPMSVTSEGVSLTGAVNYHNAGYTGAGVKVALIDVGFKGLSDAQKNGDIPYDVKTYDFPSNGIESVETKYYHGTACAEIVHDMAPDAELHLLKVSDEWDIYSALDYCRNNDIDLISLSLSTFGSGPGDGTGYLDEAFDEVRADGILVVASAGNYATYTNGTSYGGHWEGMFNDLDGDDVHEFIPDDLDSFYNVIAAYPDWDDDGNPEENEVTILMRWDDWLVADTDYDMNLYLFDNDNWIWVASSEAPQDGKDSQPPMEIIVLNLTDAEENVYYFALVVSKKSGAPVGTELEIYLGGTSMFVPFYKYSSAIATSSSSIGEPADAEGVLAVGAIDYSNWQAGPQESFSSQGPTNAWAGNSERKKPDICGPDGITSFTYGESPFSGTSASAPHVAGAAALILSQYPGLSPDELQSYIEDSVIDMGESGKDNIYGSGRMNMALSINSPAPAAGGGGGNGGGGCFIATAAFGSPMEPHVKILREIRDSYMLENPLCKAFVAFYNRYSPPAAAFIARHNRLRVVVRWGLIPMVWISQLILRFGLFEVITVFILLLALSGIPLAAVSKKRGIREITP
jgi:subtilisin family serine protease/uncharacterized membrane protein